MAFDAARGDLRHQMRMLFLLSQQKDSATYVRAYHLARKLAGRGHKVTLMAVSPERKFGAEIFPEGLLTIVETGAFGHFPLGRFTTRLYLEPGGGPADILARLRLAMSDRFDIVQLFDHSPNVALPFYLLHNRIRARFVADWCDIYHCPGGLREHNSFRLDRLYRLLGYPFRTYSRFVEHDLRRRADAVTAITPGLRDYAVSQGVPHNRVFVLEGGADVEQIKPLSRTAARLRLGLPAQGKILGFLGTFQRDLDMVIRSFIHVIAAIPDAYLLVIGTPHQETHNQVVEAGIGYRFLEAGRCPEDLLPWYLAATDALVLPLKDNRANATRWPNKMGEYMAAGRPVVVNDVGEVGRVVREYGLGLLAEQGAPSFAEKMMQLLTDDTLAKQMGKKAREAACTRYSWDILAGELEGVYRGLVAGGARAESRP